MKNKENEEDLCLSCTHKYLDFPLPLDCYIPYCEVFKPDEPLDKVVPFPCTKCPCNSYERKIKN